MNGAESLVRTLIASGVDTCFANPGTTEMHFVAALERLIGMRSVLALFEGVATGAADGYARIARKPAATLLHCGPGLANGLANLHNARRARVPIVNVVGDQATHHREFDPPLTADTESWARSVSAWTRSADRSATVGADGAAAVSAALSGSNVATLILPSDVSWGHGGIVAEPLPVVPPFSVATPEIAACARVLRSGEPTALLIGATGLEAEGLAAAYRIAAATGARLFAPTFNRLIERGRGRHPIQLLPYSVDRAVRTLAGIRNLILVGAQQPVSFFGYQDRPSLILPRGASIHMLARPEDNVIEALAALACELATPLVPPPDKHPPEPARGAPTSAAVAQTLAALIPEGAIVVDESVSFGFAFYPGTHAAAPHDWLQLCGGALGDGMPLAVGAAIAAPGRRVINLEGDGSALYTMQALWTQAREQLNVTTVILANRKYAILTTELVNIRARLGPVAHDLFDLERPTIDWLQVAGAMGVEAARASSLEQFADLFGSSRKRAGPFLIELMIE
jgi:acetolactate synthase I/II/III large subunit